MFHLPSKLGTVQLGVASYRGFLDGRWNISRPPPVRLPGFVGRIDACACCGSQALFPLPHGPREPGYEATGLVDRTSKSSKFALC